MIPPSWFTTCKDLISKVTAEGKQKINISSAAEVPKGQDHLFRFYDDLTDKERRVLDDEFDTLNLDFIQDVFDQFHAPLVDPNFRHSIFGPRPMNWDLKRPPVMDAGANVTKAHGVSSFKLGAWQKIGLDLYAQQKVAVVVMSGGLDPEMTINGLPKGVIDIGLLSHKSIFQLFCERLRRLQHLAARKFKKTVFIPLYIMCNKNNRQVIEDFFRDNKFFTLREQDVVFFSQDNMPVFDEKGKILLKTKNSIHFHPNGNGGLFKALQEGGMTSDIKSRGVTWMYVCSIDNLLTKIGDPVFLGYIGICRSDAGVKCIQRLLPDEELGLLCSQRKTVTTDVDGDGKADVFSTKTKPRIYEFRDLAEDTVKRREPPLGCDTPPLVLHSGNISEYVFKVDMIVGAAAHTQKVWHKVDINLPYINLTTGQIVEPPLHVKNARSFQMYVFDAFELLSKACGLEVSRSEFALVKRPVGPDSPTTAMQAMGRAHQQWILAAGGQFQQARSPTDRDDSKCEISPLVSYDGEDIFGQFPRPIVLPFYLPSNQEMTNFSAGSSIPTRRASAHFLEWESQLGQYELENDMRGVLSESIHHVENVVERLEYMGEEAPAWEVLPETPKALDPARARAYEAESGSARSPRTELGTVRSVRSSPTDGGGGSSARGSPRVAFKGSARESPRALRNARGQKDEEDEEKDGDESSRSPRSARNAVYQSSGMKAKAEASSKGAKLAQMVGEKRKEFWGEAKTEKY